MELDEVSPSMARIAAPTTRPSHAADLALELLSTHSGYATSVDRRPVIEALTALEASPKASGAVWVARLQALYARGFLDGRRAIAGLALIDSQVLGALQRSAFLRTLEREIVREEIKHTGDSTVRAFVDLLSPEGLRLRNEQSLGELARDATQTRSDAPASEDLLFRFPFAEGLALRIRSMRRADARPRPLMLLLDGPWGSGKSTVMDFVSRLLDDPRATADGGVDKTAAPPAWADRWISVRYNAWQHQRLEAPWWSLANAVIDQALAAQPLGPRLRLWARHLYFRGVAGREPLIVASLAAVALGIVIWPRTSTATTVGFLKDLAAVLTVVFGVIVGGARVLSGKDKLSADYLASRPDPMGALEKHLQRCLRGLGRPVIVLVDDIDRCEASAVVKLLEGVQVLFGAAPVTFLVAGDQRWVQGSFQTIYEPFVKVLGEGARPLGASFLEKTFQIAVWLPEPIDEGRSRYWRHLLGLPDEAAAQVEVDVQGLNTEIDIVQAGREIEGRGDIASRLSFRRQAVQRLAAPDIEREIETHTLAPILDLVERNPRAMKRLVMAYGLARSVDVLSGRYTPSTALALWVLLSLRWPDLAAWLRDAPERLGGGGPPDETERDVSLRRLLGSPGVKRVLTGPPGGEGLTLHGLVAILA